MKKIRGKIFQERIFFRNFFGENDIKIFWGKKFLGKKFPLTPSPPHWPKLGPNAAYGPIIAYRLRKSWNFLEKSLSSFGMGTHNLPIWRQALYPLSHQAVLINGMKFASLYYTANSSRPLLNKLMCFKHSLLTFNFNLWYWNHKDGNRKSCIFLSK